MKNQNYVQNQQLIFILTFSIFVFCNVLVLNEMPKLFKLYLYFLIRKLVF